MSNNDICVVMDILQDKNEIEVYSPLLDTRFNVLAEEDLIKDLLDDEYVAVEVDLDKRLIVS